MIFTLVVLALCVAAVFFVRSMSLEAGTPRRVSWGQVALCAPGVTLVVGVISVAAAMYCWMGASAGVGVSAAVTQTRTTLASVDVDRGNDTVSYATQNKDGTLSFGKTHLAGTTVTPAKEGSPAVMTESVETVPAGLWLPWDAPMPATYSFEVPASLVETK